MSTTAATIAGFPLIGTTPEGGRARLVGMTGWLGRTVRRERGNNTGRPGRWSAPGQDDGITIDATTLITYPDPAAAARERRALTGLGGTGAVVMRVTDAAGALQRLVEVDDVDPVVITHTLVRVEFGLFANDPYATSVTATTTHLNPGQTVRVDTPGTGTAELLVKLTSAGTVDLTAGGLRLTTRTLPAGTVIDVADLSITGPTGADLSEGNVTRYGFPALPAGGGDIKQAGTAGLDITHRDTYA